METQTYDLRDLLLMIKEQKQMDAQMALEFDCVIEAEDIRPLIKVINYAINYIAQLSDKTQQISLNASMSGITISFTAFTDKTEFPPVNPAVNNALKQYKAVLLAKGEAASYAQLLIQFTNP